jgi:hypothetical protein
MQYAVTPRAAGLGQGLFAGNKTRLQTLNLWGRSLGNDGLSNLLLPAAGGDGGMINNVMTDLNFASNNIEGEEGGRNIPFLLQCFPALKALDLQHNNHWHQVWQ